MTSCSPPPFDCVLLIDYLNNYYANVQLVIGSMWDQYSRGGTAPESAFSLSFRVKALAMTDRALQDLITTHPFSNIISCSFSPFGPSVSVTLSFYSSLSVTRSLLPQGLWAVYYGEPTGLILLSTGVTSSGTQFKLQMSFLWIPFLFKIKI